MDYSKLNKLTKYLNLFILSVGLFFLLWLLWLYAQSFFDTSLWVDEYYSVKHFTSQGALKAVTDYHVPNNHVFSSFIRAILPFGDSYNPFHARYTSYLSVFATVGIVIYMFKNKSVAIWGVISCLFLFVNEELNSEMLYLIFQARGYGLLLCLIAFFIFFVNQYIVEDKTSKLRWACLFAALAIYTIPVSAVFVFFVFVLLFLFSDKKNKKEIFYHSAVSGLVVVLLFVPILGQLVKNMETYSNDWGKAFEKPQAVFDTISKYSSIQEGWHSLLFFLLILTVHTFVPPGKGKTISQILSISSALSFVVFVHLQTPLLRTTSFLILPMIISITYPIYYLKQYNNISYLLISIFITSILSMSAVKGIKNYDFVSYENWKGAASITNKFIDKDNQNVFCDFRKGQLRVYLNDGINLVEEFNLGQFASGELVYVASNYQNFNNPVGVVGECNYLLARQVRGGRLRVFSKKIEDDNYRNLLNGKFTFDLKPNHWSEYSNKASGLKNSLLQVSFDFDSASINKNDLIQVLLLKNDSMVSYTEYKVANLIDGKGILDYTNFKKINDSYNTIVIRIKSKEAKEVILRKFNVKIQKESFI
jgi:hypothetical protein